VQQLRVVKGTDASSGPIPFSELEAVLRSTLSDREQGVGRAVALVLEQAVRHGASDVHFDPWQDCLSVRFRMDGILHDVATVPREFQEALVARIKILAKLIVYQRDVPQDGRIDGPDAPLGRTARVATFPTVNGEKAAVRLLGVGKGILSLDELGFSSAVTTWLRSFIKRPQGVLLFTGPSSSGKTTTIYALLQELLTRRKPMPHVVTLEDPVEYRLEHIAQTEINPHAGFTFEQALRAILRQDPEVIVPGEIRDAETARMAIQAGLTGHLVISTIHSGSAAGVFTRLLDMGIEPYLVASAVNGVLAQRLVRRVCTECTEIYTPPADSPAHFEFGLDAGPFIRGVGCAACEGLGYRGRTAIGELLVVDEPISDLVAARSQTRAVHDAAVAAGMTTLHAAGREAVTRHVTTPDELQRVLPPGEL
jgi:type II secretory ATPase GspE/PulE/Tfp pilus assembly ATPase PilB-like protein